jgi:hypothetical protein
MFDVSIDSVFDVSTDVTVDVLKDVAFDVSIDVAFWIYPVPLVSQTFGKQGCLGGVGRNNPSDREINEFVSIDLAFRRLYRCCVRRLDGRCDVVLLYKPGVSDFSHEEFRFAFGTPVGPMPQEGFQFSVLKTHEASDAHEVYWNPF